MQSVTTESDMQLLKPAVPYTYRRKHKDKYCQATVSHKKQRKCEYNDSKIQISRNSDKNCQENEKCVM